MRTSESTVKLVAALVAARKAFAPIVKDSKGQVAANRDYWYAALPGILEATLPALLENGIMVLQAIDAETSSLITRLAHVSGEWVEAQYALKLDLPAQQLGSALSYGRRYSLSALLCLAADDDDGAAAHTGKPTPQKVATPPRSNYHAPPATRPLDDIDEALASLPAPGTAAGNSASQGRPENVDAATRENRGTLISEPQVKRMFAISKAAGWTNEALKAWLLETQGITSSKDITKAAYPSIIAKIELGPGSYENTADMLPVDEVF